MSGYGPDINQNWSGSSFVPGDGCNRSGDQQEARKTCIPGRLIIKLATATSFKQQATSLTAGQGYCRMDL